MKKISLVLDKYLKTQGVSRYKLRQLTELSDPTIRSYCRNDLQRYDVVVLEKICDALNCNLFDIIQCVDVDEQD